MSPLPPECFGCMADKEWPGWLNGRRVYVCINCHHFTGKDRPSEPRQSLSPRIHPPTDDVGRDDPK